MAGYADAIDIVLVGCEAITSTGNRIKLQSYPLRPESLDIETGSEERCRCRMADPHKMLVEPSVQDDT